MRIIWKLRIKCTAISIEVNASGICKWEKCLKLIDLIAQMQSFAVAVNDNANTFRFEKRERQTEWHEVKHLDINRNRWFNALYICAQLLTINYGAHYGWKGINQSATINETNTPLQLQSICKTWQTICHFHKGSFHKFVFVCFGWIWTVNNAFDSHFKLYVFFVGNGACWPITSMRFTKLWND